MRKLLIGAAVIACLLTVLARETRAQSPAGTYICDVAYQDCRADVLTLIRNETVGIDVSFWFMTDARYSNELVKRWQAGVPVRVIMDPRANTSKPANALQLQQLQDAGIPMLNKPFGDIAHWKGMIFAGQKVAEFSGANYSPYEYTYEIPYVKYQDESIYFSKEPDVVQSLMRRFDDVWVNTVYTFYANPIPRVRTYPTSYVIAPEFNLPPDDSYTDRLLPLIDAENEAIDVVMFRITDARPADALIRAVRRGVPVRLYAEPLEYRNPARLEDPYNVDRMYVAGVHVKMRAHDGQNHQKTVRLVGQQTTVFGTSNWSTASDDNQLEVNYFTTKSWFYQFFASQFEWKWNNQPLDGSGVAQTAEFVPLAPDSPSYRSPANGATGVNASSVALKWYAGPWARSYDLYLGAGPNPPLYRNNVQLGPSQSSTDLKSITVTGLLPGTTYSWKVVSRTMANVTSTGPMWTFTTAGTPPADPPPPAPDTTAPAVFLYAPANGATLSGTRQLAASVSDNGAIAGVQFKIDGANLGAQDRSAPFSLSWDTNAVPNGAHTLTAEAVDVSGNVGTSSPVSVTISNGPAQPDTTPPSVAITAPSAAATVSGTISVMANGSDDLGVAGVQFRLDGVDLGAEDTAAPYAVSWNTTSTADGTHTLTARARDAAGNTAVSAAVSVTVSNSTPPPPPPSDTIVLHAAGVAAGDIVGNWVRSTDATAADGIALWNVDHGAAKITPALAAPQNYVEMTFQATAGTPYHLWVRMRAQNDYFGNDSIHVQFSDAVNASGGAIYRIGSSGTDNSAQVALEESDGNGVSGWGWADQGWNGLGPDIYFASSGTHTLRIQQREDGAMFDQIVLSPDTYLTVAPGTQKRDTTILPVSKADTMPPTVSLSAPAAGSTVSGTVAVTASSSDDTGVAGVRFLLDGAAIGSEDATAPYSMQWDTTSVSNGAHSLTAVARDAAGNTATSAAVAVTVSNDGAPPDTAAPTVAITAPADGATVSGTTSVSADSTDNVGVVGVRFQLDGLDLGAEDVTAPYSVSWNTASASSGAHTLTAIAHDVAGNVATSTPIHVTVSNATPVEVVLWAADVAPENVFGNWVRSMDGTAAGGVSLWNTDNGAAKIAPALAVPQNYVNVTFNAQAGTPYHLWIRMRAQNDYFGNDSIHVQFSDSVDASGAAIYRIGSSGSTNSAQVVLEEADNNGVSGWGWADQGWNGLGPNIYFATSGTHTLRIQQREDGVMFDQIVLSPATFLTAPPGPQKRDTTIVPKG